MGLFDWVEKHTIGRKGLGGFMGGLKGGGMGAWPTFSAPPTKEDPEVQRAKRMERLLARRRTGFFSMFTSSRAGVLDKAPTTKKTLFGD